MRRQLLTSTAAAAVAAGTLALAAPATPAHAAEWTHTDDITDAALTNVSSRVLDVAAYGEGFAAAVWFEPGANGRQVVAARFQPNTNGGQWVGATPISTAGHNAYDPIIEVNDNGDLVAAWSETHDNVEEVYAAVQPVGSGWTAPTLLTPGATNVLNGIDVGIANDRTVYAAASYVDGDDAAFGLRVIEWDHPAAPDSPLIVSSQGRLPSLDVSGSGEVVLAFKSDAQSQYAYTRHHPGGGWTAAVPVGGATTVAPSAAINDSGRAAVAFVSNDASSVNVQRVDPAGAKHGAVATLAPNAAIVAPSVDINDGGRLLVAWADTQGGPALGHATSAFGGAWTTATEPAATGGVDQVDAAVAATGAQAVGYAYGGREVVLDRPRPTATFSEWVSAAGYADDHAIAVDTVGDVVAVAAPEQPVAPLHARYLDAIGPTTTISAFPGNVLDSGLAMSPTVFLTATGTDWLSGLDSVDVVARVARWNEAAYGARTVVMNDQPEGESLGFVPQPGRSYCLAVRGTDGVGNIGAVSSEHCFTTPLDDLALTATGWNRAEGTAHYRGTVTTTKTKGRVLVRKGVKAKRIALVVAKSPGGGKVQVRLGDQLLGTYSLDGTGAQQVIDVASFAHVRSGTLRITVVSADKLVRVDGVVIAK